MGIAFKRAFVVNNCVSNVLNALATRHLVAFRYPILELPPSIYLYTPPIVSELVSSFWEGYRVGAWRSGKTATRCAVIERSLVEDVARPSTVLAHIKTEVSLTRPTKARLIQAFHHPVDNYLCADEYRAFTHALVAVTAIPRTLLGMQLHLRSACGLSRSALAAQMSEWLLCPFDQLIMDDLSNMDGSVQLPWLERQVALYAHMSLRLSEHARQGIHFRGRVNLRDATVHYTAHATVRSGDQDTSSGQTCRRLDSLVAVLHQLGVSRASGFVFGDDVWCLVSPPLSGVEYELALQRYGFVSKFASTTEPMLSDFISCSLVPDFRGGYALVPKPGRLLAKLFWTWRVVSPRRQASYVRQVAQAFLPVYQGFRFMEAWLAWHMHVPVERVWHGDLPLAGEPHPHPLDWERFLWVRYTLPPPPPDLFDLLSSVPSGSVAILSHPWTRAIMEYDIADPADRPYIVPS